MSALPEPEWPEWNIDDAPPAAEAKQSASMPEAPPAAEAQGKKSKRTPPMPEAPPAIRTFQFVSTNALRAMDIPPVEWLIVSVLPAQLVSTIVGASGAGKTWVSLSLLRAWATGDAWLGQYPARKCHAALLDAEDSFKTLKLRWLQLEQGMGALPDGAINPSWLSDIGAFDILEEPAKLGLIEALKNFDVCIVDSLAQSHTFDENSSDMRTVMQAWEEVSRLSNCAILLCHHTGWEKSRMRGSSAIKDRSQSVLQLTRDAETPVTSLRLDKSKHGPSLPHVGSMRIEGSWDGPVRLEFLAGKATMGVDANAAAALKANARAYLETHLRGVEMAQKDVVAGMRGSLHCGQSRAYALLRVFVEEAFLISSMRGRGQWLKLSEQTF